MDALDPRLVGSCDRLVVVSGARASALQAAFCAVPVLRDAPAEIGLVMCSTAEDDAQRVASRLPWGLLAAIPSDPYLERDDFAVRGPTLRAVDRLIRACA